MVPHHALYQFPLCTARLIIEYNTRKSRKMEGAGSSVSLTTLMHSHVRLWLVLAGRMQCLHGRSFDA